MADKRKADDDWRRHMGCNIGDALVSALQSDRGVPITLIVDEPVTRTVPSESEDVPVDA